MLTENFKIATFTHKTLAKKALTCCVFSLSVLTHTALAAASPTALEQDIKPLVVGKASDVTSGEFLYSEHHYCDEQRKHCLVSYRDNTGASFAQKRLDYSQNIHGPAVHLTDTRQGVELKIPASADSELVIDAGFDNFVRSIWEPLTDNEEVAFTFLVAGFDKPFKMQASRNQAVECDPAQLCLEIKLTSWLMRLLADPIELKYSLANRQLVSFKGVSNIKGTEGESLQVEILYSYE